MTKFDSWTLFADFKAAGAFEDPTPTIPTPTRRIHTHAEKRKANMRHHNNDRFHGKPNMRRDYTLYSSGRNNAWSKSAKERRYDASAADQLREHNFNTAIIQRELVAINSQLVEVMIERDYAKRYYETLFQYASKLECEFQKLRLENYADVNEAMIAISNLILAHNMVKDDLNEAKANFDALETKRLTLIHRETELKEEL